LPFDIVTVQTRREHHEQWLDPEFQDTDRLAQLLVPYPARQVKAYPVSPLVNNPKFEDERCIAPLPVSRVSNDVETPAILAHIQTPVGGRIEALDTLVHREECVRRAVPIERDFYDTADRAVAVVYR
jgi:hypothetical protein